MREVTFGSAGWHEVAGEVSEIGAGVSRVKVGDRVAVNPSLPCWRCRGCQAGRTNLCRRMTFFGSAAVLPHVQGAFQEQLVAHESQCFVVPASTPFIFVGTRVALGASWATLVASELVAAPTGLGRMMQSASQFLQTDRIVVGIIIIGVLGFAMDRLIILAERRLTSWQELRS